MKAGYFKGLFVSTVEDIDLQFQIFSLDKFEKLQEQKFGGPYDPNEAFVAVELRGNNHPLGNSNADLAGSVVDLSCPYRRAWVIDANDDLVPGNTILADGTWSEVTFEGVQKGTCDVLIEPPPGYVCLGRDQAWIPNNHWAEVPHKCSK